MTYTVKPCLFLDWFRVMLGEALVAIVRGEPVAREMARFLNSGAAPEQEEVQADAA